MNQWLLFQEDKRIERLNRLGDRLDVLNRLIPWENFRTTLESIYVKENPFPQGRRPYDVVLMFKILILQGLYNFSDESAEYLIADRLSFQKFLGIAPDQSVPDARTIWLFRERLKKNNIHNLLFEQFNRFLDSSGYEAKGGQIVDASFVEVPRQRNTREENKHIKETGTAPEDWSAKKKAHKDVDARWTKKNKTTFFGFKDHIDVDQKHKIIRRFSVTDASVHDSQEFIDLLDAQSEDKSVWADSAYVGEEYLRQVRQLGLIPQVCEKGYRNKPLTEEQKQSNRTKSKIRCRVEHAFGLMHQISHGSELIRTIGLARAKIKIAIRNLAYNIYRFFQCEKRQLCTQ